MAYLLLNTSLNMLNRWALGKYHFRFPLILTASHMLVRCFAFNIPN